MITQKYLDQLTYDVLGAAITVHKELGSGLLESIYQLCLMEELNYKNIEFKKEFKIPIIYKGKELVSDFRCDLLIENCLVIELKSVSEIQPIHEAQLLSYMKLLKAPNGILINFNCFNLVKYGQKT